MLIRPSVPLAAALAVAACSHRGADAPPPTEARPWAAFYGKAIAQLRSHGAVVISYMNVGACERFRTYWSSTGAGGPLPCGANAAAQLGPYSGYPDEVWMDLSNPEYQNLT
jgi:hypothetical protein